MYIIGLICFDTFQSKFTFRPRRAIQMNLPVLIKTAQIWVDIFDYEACGSARTPPLPSLASEVLLSMTVQCGWQCKSFMKVLSEHQLTQPWLHSMGCGAGEKILVAYGCDWLWWAAHQSQDPCWSLGCSKVDVSCSPISATGQGTTWSLNAMSHQFE